MIILVSSIPSKSIPAIFSMSWDKLLHIIEYSILGFLGYRAYYEQINFKIHYLIIFGILFGCFDELWQQNIPGRISSHYDAIADGIGVIFGAYLGNIFYREIS